MIATSPEHAVELLDRAFAQGDLDAVLSFYEDAAVVITEPGKAARGTAELRSFFARAMQSGSSAKQLQTQVIEADGVALFMSRWVFRGAAERTFTATTYFAAADGGWKALIDHPFGLHSGQSSCGLCALAGAGMPCHAEGMERDLVPFSDDHGVYGEQEGVLHVFIDNDAPRLVLHHATADGAAGRSVVLVGDVPNFL